MQLLENKPGERNVIISVIHGCVFAVFCGMRRLVSVIELILGMVFTGVLPDFATNCSDQRYSMGLLVIQVTVTSKLQLCLQ